VPDAAWVATLWALLRCGATLCPINPAWPTAAVDEALGSVDVSRRLTSEQWSAMFARADADAGADAAASVEDLDAGVDAERDDIARRTIAAHPATILFSSGSSGRPKAIAHDLDAHLASARGANHNLPLAPGDAWLLSLPLFHVSGLGILFRCLVAGATVVIPPAESTLADQIQRQRPTHLSLVPTQLSRLIEQLQQPPRWLRAVLLGGAPLPATLIARAHAAGWPLLTTYGSTEMASQVTTTRVGATADELQTAGKVLPGRELTLSPEGEILVRGATLFLGYVRGPAIDRPLDQQGWFATGDLGRWDKDGRLIVEGRRDNLFISGGENIYPEEIERELLNLPNVHQAIVVPVANPQYGQRPVAFVDSDVWQPDRWRQALAARLPRYKLPDSFLAWPEPTGLKANRTGLRELAATRLG
jgi:O-succinylbenzoic acid--CoA ligase